MRRLGAPVTVALTVIALASCGDADDGGEADADGGDASVVVTTNILGDIAANVIGDEADVEVLMPRNADPHGFGISAAQSASMTEADLVIANGLGLEASIAANLDAASDAGVPILEIAPRVDPIAFTDDGADAGEPDPHVWTDPDRMITAIELIADEVAEHVDGVDEEVLRLNASSYAEQIAEVADQIEDEVAGLPEDRRKLVTNHHVFGYYAERFGFEVVGAVLPSGTTLASPSAADLADLATTIEEAGVPAIFADSSQPDELAAALAGEVGLDVEVVSLFTESLGEEGSGAATYLEMMTTNTARIVEVLGA